MNIACMLRDLQEKTLFHHTKWRDIFAYLNDFNNSFTSRFKRKLSEAFMLWENDRFIILNVRYLRHSKVFANVSVEILFVAFAFLRFRSLLLAHLLWDLRLQQRLNTHSWTSHQGLTVCRSRRRSQLIASKRSWKRTKSNVTSVHRIQHLRSNIELTSLSYHIEC